MQRKYYWFDLNRENDETFSDMRRLIKNYCEFCFICKRSKTFRHKSYDELESLSVSKFKWSNLIMNFVIDLSKSRNWNEVIYDFILIIVDRFTKMIHYVSVFKTVSAENLVEILIREVVRLHDLSDSIITNRDFVFTAKYYFFFCYALKIKAKFSTIFHSQTND